MPGRTSTRSTRSARSSTATTSTTTRKSAGRTRPSVANIQVPDEGPDISLRTEIANIFSDAQSTTATQRKLQTLLRKIQERCCFEQPESKKKKAPQEEEFDEEDFNNEVTRCLLRVLNVKKGVQEADRVIRFLGLFLKNASEKDRQIYQQDGEDATEISDTPTNRLVGQIVHTLIGILFPADGNPVHNKIVHFRATQTLAHIIGQLSALDDDVFALIRVCFKKLSRHKESAVRVQAVLGLSRLMNTDDEEDEEDEDDDVSRNIMEKLIDMMQNDPSAEVRRTITNNMEQTKETMRYIFERARDMDPLVRRIVYRKVLPSLGDFRFMKLVEREKLLRWGLRDRDDIVRKAAARVFCEKWLEDCASTYDTRSDEEKKPGEPAPPSLEAARELLERIDVVGYDGEDGIAHDAMQHFWEIRTDYRDFVTFDHDYWKQLDAQSAFLARSLNDYCNNLNETTDIKLKQDLEDKFLETEPFAYIVKVHLNALLDGIKEFYMKDPEEDQEELRRIQEDIEDKEFIVQQLLHIGLTLDYSPPVGRSQMMNIMREALSCAELPEECTKLAVQVLRCCCNTEAEFCAIILEAVADVKDTLMPDDDTAKGDDDDESFHSAQSDVESDGGDTRSKKSKATKEMDPEEEERRHELEISVYLKCLHIAQCSLQTVVQSDFTDSSLVAILNTLIIPAVRGQEAMIRERGLTCLALASILSKDLAQSNIELFFHCFNKGHDALKEIVLQALVDIVWQHRSLLQDEPSEEGGEPTPSQYVKPLQKAVLKGLKSENHSISLIACTAASKLLLFDLLPPEETAVILREFALAYFDPETAQYPGVRQALSYFLPTYCHSKLKNAILMARVCVPIVTKLLQKKEDIDEDDDEMVGWPVITAHLADWTDGRKVVNQTQLGLDGKPSTTLEAEEPHICLATEILEHTLTRNCSRDERKPMLTLLTKVYIAPSGRAPDEEALSALQQLVTEAVESKLGMDATQRNYLTKLDVNLTKRIGDVETVNQAAETDAETDAETAAPEAAEIPETAPTEDEQEDEEDTMMAGIQGESTRMPLNLEGDDDDEMDIDVPGHAVTEDDIVNSLLASEMDDDEEEEEEDDTITLPSKTSRR